MTRVLDAHALLAYLEKEPGYEKVKAAFLEAVEKDTDLLMTSVNFGEVYYVISRECGQQKADEIEKVIQTLPIEIVPVDLPLAREAARFRAKYEISYGICSVIALSKLRKAELLAGGQELIHFKNEAKISWI
ncbi:MAG: type II toxin-antitoxin system VapC family toxin [Spirochaetota bacterium]